MVNWAVQQEEDPTLQGELQYLRTHRKATLRTARHIAKLHEELELHCQSFYRSSGHLANANAHARLYRRISCDLSPDTSIFNKCKIQNTQRSVEERCPQPVKGHCDWCSKEGHEVTTCYRIGYCRHCKRQGHGDGECCHPHDLCRNGEYCQVYPTHPQFECGWCHSDRRGINDDILSDISF